MPGCLQSTATNLKLLAKCVEAVKEEQEGPHYSWAKCRNEHYDTRILPKVTATCHATFDCKQTTPLTVLDTAAPEDQTPSTLVSASGSAPEETATSLESNRRAVPAFGAVKVWRLCAMQATC